MSSSDDTKYYAHSVEGRPTDEWQPLDEHLKGTAELADNLQKNSAQAKGLIWRDCGMIWGKAKTWFEVE